MCLGAALLVGLPQRIYAQEAATTRPADDPGVIDELVTLSAKLQGVKDLVTPFRQEKHTAMLRKPLVSTGTIRMTKRVMRWDTYKPAESVMLITDKDVRLYYPQQSLLEVYQLDQQMAKLAASPIPQIDLLREHFVLTRGKAGDLQPGAGDGRYLAVIMLPKDKTLQEHLDQVKLLIDRQTGYLSLMDMVDADGDETAVRFEDVKLNTGVKESDLELKVPAGTKVSYPLGDRGEK